MRLVKGIAAMACFVVGVWLTLRAAGLLTAVLHAVPRWWPALPAAVGAAILARSRRSGPHTAASLVLIAASCVAFAITRHLIAVSVWPFAAGAGLMAVGLALAYLATRPSSRAEKYRSQRIVMAFRPARVSMVSADVARIRVYALCGRLDVDVRDCLSPGSLRDYPLMIEIVACLASVSLIAHPDVLIYRHQAFVMRSPRSVRHQVLSDEDTYNAAGVVATLAFFGDVTLTARYPAVAAPGG
jgi:LiaF transmembrane domain